MPLPFLRELATSGEVKAALQNPSKLRQFVAGGYGSAEATRAAVYAATPTLDLDYPFLWRAEIDVKPQGGDVYFVDVPYALLEGRPIEGGEAGSQHPDPPADDDKLGPELSFDTTGATETVTKSITTLAKAKVGGGLAPDFAKAVNVTPDGVKGVERAAPKFDWTLTAHFPWLTYGYCNRLKVMSGRAINKRLFFGRWAGECLFLGATGTWRQSDAWSVTFKFRDSPTWGTDAWKQKYLPGSVPGNAAQSPQRPFNDSLLDLLTNGDGNKIKRGWDYLWVMFEESSSNGRKVSSPYAAYIEQLYYDFDFYWLGIGGAAVPPANDRTPPENQNL